MSDLYIQLALTSSPLAKPMVNLGDLHRVFTPSHENLTHEHEQCDAHIGMGKCKFCQSDSCIVECNHTDGHNITLQTCFESLNSRALVELLLHS